MGCSPSKHRPKPAVVSHAADSSIPATRTQSPRFVLHCQTAAENPETPTAVEVPFIVRERFKMLRTPTRQGGMHAPANEDEATDLHRTLKKKQLIARVAINEVLELRPLVQQAHAEALAAEQEMRMLEEQLLREGQRISTANEKAMQLKEALEQLQLEQLNKSASLLGDELNKMVVERQWWSDSTFIPTECKGS